MKKPHISILVLITVVFAAFTLGFFTGRNANHASVQLSRVTEPTQTVPETTAEIASSTAEDDTTEADSPTESTTEYAGLLNINTATHAELMTLPGIGEVLAQRIIDYREENGDFRAVEELLNVSGIGEKKLEGIIDLVTTGG